MLFHTRLYKKDAHSIVEVKKLVAFGLERLVSEDIGNLADFGWNDLQYSRNTK